MTPPSIPPPPPPPPPLNIPPSRARLQLAARLAMHQKSNQSAQPSSATLHHNGDEDDDNAVDPFRDGDDDIDDDDDDDLAADVAQESGRGSWWRSMVGGKGNADDSDEGDEDGEEEFGDFAMAEDEKSGGGVNDDLVLRPLPVHPAKESSRGLSGLWPFGSRSDSKTRREDDREGSKREEDVASTAEKKGAGEDSKAIEVKEATSRTSIEEPDEDEVVIGAAGGTKKV